MVNHRECIGLRVFLHPLFHISFLGIKFFSLRPRIENTKIRCSVTTTSSGPLPVPIIGGQIVIQKLFSKICFTPPPVDQQMFNQKTCHNHPYPVVHPAGFVKLPHTCIYTWISGLPFAPHLKLFFIVTPNDTIILSLNTLVRHSQEVILDHHEKFSPYQFVEPSLAVLLSHSYQLAHTHQTKPQISAHTTSSCRGR